MTMRLLLITFLITIGAQLNAQSVIHVADKQPSAPYENIKVETLHHDSLASTYIIWIRKNVPMHFHKTHTEVVYVVEGSGTMMLNETEKEIKEGDYIFIPMGTKHSVEVKSNVPMKVISVQSPEFDGSDRHFVTQE